MGSGARVLLPVFYERGKMEKEKRLFIRLSKMFRFMARRIPGNQKAFRVQIGFLVIAYFGRAKE